MRRRGDLLAATVGGLAHVGVLGTAFDWIHHVADGEVMNGSSGF